MRVLLATTISDQRFNTIPDLGLGYLASMIRQAGHEVCVVDCLLENMDFASYAALVDKVRPDMVGIKLFSCDASNASQMLDQTRRVAPNAVSIIGGPHASYELPEHLMEQLPSLDYALAGEGEPGIVSLIKGLASGNMRHESVPGLIWRDSSGVHANARDYAQDLDALPFPAWDLIDPRRYKSGYSFMTTRLPAAPMVMTRGCPYLCTFCGSHLITGRKVRRRSVDGVIEEMKWLVRDFGVRTIDIVDENFAFDRSFVFDFCERLIHENLGLVWNCPYGVRLTSLDEEMVKMMARAGCSGMSVGIESGSDRILQAIQKSLTVDQARNQVRMIKRVSNIMLQGYFMLGFPEETREDIEKTIELSCSLPFDIVTFCPLRVTPGTEVYSRLVTEGRIPAKVNYDGLGQHYFVRSYCAIPDHEMRKLYRKAYARFYFRPKVFLGLLRRVATVAQLKTIANGLWRMVRSPKSRRQRL